MSSIPDEYKLEAETSEMLETCDESRMLIESMDNIIEDNGSQGEKYFVVTEVPGEETNLIEFTEAEKLDDTDAVEQNQFWDEICRICANPSDHLIPIFQGEGLEHEIDNKIHRYLPIQVSKEDNLPLHLCYHCAATLLAWHELAVGCLAAEQRLLQMQTGVKHKIQPTILDNSLDKECGVSTIESPHVSIKSQLLEEQPEIKGESNEEKIANKSERSHREDYTMSVLEKPIGEIEETYAEERIEYVECGKCEATYIEIADLVTHMNTDHNDLVHYCIYCKIVYRGNQKSFDEHEKSHMDEFNRAKKTICIINGDNGALEVEEGEGEGEGEEEEEEEGEGEGEEVEDKREEKSYNCDLCDKIFEKKKELRRHINTHDESEYIENNEETEILKNAKIVVENRCLYECKTCAKHIVTKRGFLRHIRIHTGNRPCRCTICGNQYRIKQDLARHIRDVHDRIKKYQCEICARPFANKGAKEDHQRIHTGERPYSCKLCKKTFRTLNSIYIHNRIHTNYKPHKCPSCDKQFPSRQRLTNHLTTHTGVKEFSCEICFKQFSVKGEVVRHRAIHSQDKPFVCTICGMKFGQKRYLRNHIKQHHKEQSSLLLAKLTGAPH